MKSEQAVLPNPCLEEEEEDVYNFSFAFCYVRFKKNCTSFVRILIHLIIYFMKQLSTVRGCIQKFPDWPPGAKTANGTTLPLDAVVSLFCESV
jgi:hypothetical protein